MKRKIIILAALSLLFLSIPMIAICIDEHFNLPSPSAKELVLVFETVIFEVAIIALFMYVSTDGK